MTELEVAAFRRDCAALAGHVRAGLRGDGFGETARQALDKLVTLAYGAGGLGEETPFRDLLATDTIEAGRLRGRIATLERELLAARAVVAQSRNVSPRICGAAGVLDETVKAYDAVVNKGQE